MFKKFLTSLVPIAFDAGMIALLVLWKRDGLDGAGNAFLAVSWALVVFQILTGLMFASKGIEWNPSLFTRYYCYTRFMVKVIGYAWLGLFWLFIAYLVGQVFLATARHTHKMLHTKAAD